MSLLPDTHNTPHWDEVLDELKAADRDQYEQFLQYMLERIQKELGK